MYSKGVGLLFDCFVFSSKGIRSLIRFRSQSSGLSAQWSETRISTSGFWFSSQEEWVSWELDNCRPLHMYISFILMLGFWTELKVLLPWVVDVVLNQGSPCKISVLLVLGLLSHLYRLEVRFCCLVSNSALLRVRSRCSRPPPRDALASLSSIP